VVFMGKIVQRQKNVEALKLLNNAVVTSRLYPPEAPQVGTAVERGYKGLKVLLREQGALRFCFKNNWPWIGEESLDQETLDSFPNLVIYRQLRQLGLPQLLLGAEMDRFAFGQILSVFNTSLEKVKKAGGGLAYITGLGLSDFFPEEQEGAGGTAPSEEAAAGKKRKLVKVNPELLSCLYGRDCRPQIEEELQRQLASPQAAVDLLSAAIGQILQDILKKGVSAASPLFPEMLRGVEARLAAGEQRPVLLSLGQVLVDHLREPALSVLLSQEYPPGLGKSLYDALVGALSNDSFGKILVLFREQIVRERVEGGDASPQMVYLGAAIKRLMDTVKGKQFFSNERAKEIIHEGEVTRRKRRINTGVGGLLQKRHDLLKSDEMLQALPEVVVEKLANQRQNEAEILVACLSAFLRESVADEAAYAVAVRLGEQLITTEHRSLIDGYLPSLFEVLKRAALANEASEKVVRFLHQLMQASWDAGENSRGDAILALFYAVRSGHKGRLASLSAMVGTIQDKGIQRAKLPGLLAECLSSPLDDAIGRRLAQQGPVAQRFLVESLINTEDMDDRLRIIDLLTDYSTWLSPIILERLPEHMPWYGKRNLLKLLAEAGREEDAESVLPYLRHDDYRVQHQAFVCLFKIGGKNRKKLFLSALEDSSELIKIQLIGAIGSFCDQEAATQLCELLLDSQQFSDKYRVEIILQLLDTLGRSGTAAAQKGVVAFLQSRGEKSVRNLPEQVWGSAEKALQHVESDLQEQRKKHLQAGQLRNSAMQQAARLQSTNKEQRVTTGLPQEKTVRSLLAQKDLEGAKQLLLQLVEKSARGHNFAQADNLREWLIEIAPNDFQEIIKAAEIINREKVSTIDKSHLEIWSKLYGCLSVEEFAALYHDQKPRQYSDGEIIVERGMAQTALFFINRGKVKLYFDKQGDEVLVKTMGPGEIFGADTFFNASLWTISVASMGSSDISSLKLGKLREWREQYPGLESKLHDFCAKFERIDEYIMKGNKDRRSQERYRVSGRVATTLVDERGKSLGINAVVELMDLSLGGICYQVRISNKENARLLLGRKVQIRMPAGEKSGEFELLVGDILGVHSVYAVESDYAVHVKFDTPLDKSRLGNLLRAAGNQGWAA
jgi:CRP-like cAMP-binding protein